MLPLVVSDSQGSVRTCRVMYPDCRERLTFEREGLANKTVMMFMASGTCYDRRRTEGRFATSSRLCDRIAIAGCRTEKRARGHRRFRV